MLLNQLIKTLLVLVVSVGIASPVLSAEVKIGAAEALTGPAAKYGVAIKNGLTLAADEINTKGGVNGDKLVLIAEDEQGKKEEAINVFKKLILKYRSTIAQRLETTKLWKAIKATKFYDWYGKYRDLYGV